MNCKIGDLAIVVRAEFRCNIGNIVRITACDDGTGDLVFTRPRTVWIAESARPMQWKWKGKIYRRKVGPVPDDLLQPIRASDADEDVAQIIQRLMRNSGSAPQPLNFQPDLVGVAS